MLLQMVLTVTLIVAVVVIFALVATVRRLQSMLTVDELTGLSNPKGLQKDGKLVVGHALRELSPRKGLPTNDGATEDQSPLAVMMVDVGRFKLVNDRYGHGFADGVLRHIASEVLNVRGSDVVARKGGDEFVLIVQSCEVAAVVKRLKEKLAVINADLAARGSDPVQISLGLGVAEMYGDRVTLKSFLVDGSNRRIRHLGNLPLTWAREGACFDRFVPDGSKLVDGHLATVTGLAGKPVTVETLMAAADAAMYVSKKPR